MRSTILVAAALAFASLALGGCTADAQDPVNPVNSESTVTSGQGSSPIAETKLRDGVAKAPAVNAFDDNARDIATKDGADRFDAKRVDGVKNPAANLADGKRDVIIGGAGSDGLADPRRDVSGNGGPAAGLADGMLDNVEQPSTDDMFDVALDDAVQVNANKDDIRRKARAAK